MRLRQFLTSKNAFCSHVHEILAQWTAPYEEVWALWCRAGLFQKRTLPMDSVGLLGWSSKELYQNHYSCSGDNFRYALIDCSDAKVAVADNLLHQVMSLRSFYLVSSYSSTWHSGIGHLPSFLVAFFLWATWSPAGSSSWKSSLPPPAHWLENCLIFSFHAPHWFPESQKFCKHR